MGLETAIKATIDYASKYGCDLTWEEIKERLISKKIYNLKILNYKFKKENNNKFWKEKMKLAKEFTDKYLAKIDDILMVGVTGSLASKYPQKNDDIDLMIITRKDSLWLTRFKVFLIFWKFKIPHRTNNNDICINLWLEEMRIPLIKQNLRNAVDLVLMRPILNKQDTYKKFLLKNKWAKKYVASPYLKKNADFELQTLDKNKQNWVKWVINRCLYSIQYLYMRPKMKGELVNLRQAFFHLFAITHQLY
ncbi:MAG: hypothetical protein NTY75_02495 [Candidatus Shapirobacteria bacterium]|nr:hypothetical protein [Candidatus Shapirobacteria bacterium]